MRGEKVEIGRVEISKRQVPSWTFFLEEAKRASFGGDVRRAKAFALKAMAANPPHNARYELLAILKRAA